MSLVGLYVDLVKSHPIAASAAQVALLGTLGELIAGRIRGRAWMPFSAGQLLLKVLVWAFLGVAFKYAFAGFFGFVDALAAKGYWPSVEGRSLWRAVSVSTYCNLLFGPVMMGFHRVTDCMIERRPMDWSSLRPAWLSLLWFWIPAHTLTFSVPADFQVGLAALWAVALGVLLGLLGRRQPVAA